jgi:hypothetical protein
MNLHLDGMIFDMVRHRVHTLATVLLAIGLVVAIALDGDLPAPMAKGLFLTLMGLDFVMIRWLMKVNNA